MQGKSLADSRKATSPFTRDIMFHSQDSHLCFDPRLGRAVQWRKNDIHLDDRIHRRACGGQNINAAYTDVPCGSFTLEVIAARPLPTENCRGLHSIANGLPPFDRMLSCFRDARVSNFHGSTETSQWREDYGNQGSSASGYKSDQREIVLLQLISSFSRYTPPHYWVDPLRSLHQRCVTWIEVAHQRQTLGTSKTNVHYE
jgi:hypothetical protein